jgi:hypothetical protein
MDDMSTSVGIAVLRDAVLNAILCQPANAVLNAGPAGESSALFHDLSKNLQRALHAIKAEAIDESGRYVDYARLARSPALAEYRSLAPALRDLNIAHIITRQERLAFWLNLYNALVIDAVVTYGLRLGGSGGRFGVFTFLRRAAYDVGGMRFSCDDIEHGILRGNRGHPFLPGSQFGTLDPRRNGIIDPLDARLHFALNCGTRSCPPIGVYDADQIDAQLTLATRNFLNRETGLDPQSGRLRVPGVFRRRAQDFGGRPGVIAFLLYYLPGDERRRWLEAQGSRPRFGYPRYNWRLNTRG